MLQKKAEKVLDESNSMLKFDFKANSSIQSELSPLKKSSASKAVLKNDSESDDDGDLETKKLKKRYRCKICAKVFTYKSNLLEHYNEHKDNEKYFVKCDECGKIISNKNDLNRHMKLHTDEKKYGCDECEKKFHEKSDLTRHKRTHTGEKPYKCKLCQNNFTQKKSLVAHMRIHTGSKPFACAQ